MKRRLALRLHALSLKLCPDLALATILAVRNEITPALRAEITNELAAQHRQQQAAQRAARQ